MLYRFLQNQEVGMKKDTYFEMCEMLGTEPVEEEIPLEPMDFPLIVQAAFSVYTQLQDEWEPMSGQYLGKVKHNFIQVLTLLGVEPEDFREIFVLINHIDSVRISLNKKSAPPTTPAKP